MFADQAPAPHVLVSGFVSCYLFWGGGAAQKHHRCLFRSEHRLMPSAHRVGRYPSAFPSAVQAHIHILLNIGCLFRSKGRVGVMSHEPLGVELGSVE